MTYRLQTEYNRSIYNWKILSTREKVMRNYNDQYRSYMKTNDRIGYMRYVIDTMRVKRLIVSYADIMRYRRHTIVSLDDHIIVYDPIANMIRRRQ